MNLKEEIKEELKVIEHVSILDDYSRNVDCPKSEPMCMGRRFEEKYVTKKNPKGRMMYLCPNMKWCKMQSERNIMKKVNEQSPQ